MGESGCSLCSSAHSLEAHVRSSLRYFAWSCGLCAVRFLDVPSARRHFRPEISKHPGHAELIVEETQLDKELQVVHLLNEARQGQALKAAKREPGSGHEKDVQPKATFAGKREAETVILLDSGSDTENSTEPWRKRRREDAPNMQPDYPSEAATDTTSLINDSDPEIVETTVPCSEGFETRCKKSEPGLVQPELISGENHLARSQEPVAQHDQVNASEPPEKGFAQSWLQDSLERDSSGETQSSLASPSERVLAKASGEGMRESAPWTSQEDEQWGPSLCDRAAEESSHGLSDSPCGLGRASEAEAEDFGRALWQPASPREAEGTATLASQFSLPPVQRAPLSIRPSMDRMVAAGRSLAFEEEDNTDEERDLMQQFLGQGKTPTFPNWMTQTIYRGLLQLGGRKRGAPLDDGWEEFERLWSVYGFYTEQPGLPQTLETAKRIGKGLGFGHQVLWLLIRTGLRSGLEVFVRLCIRFAERVCCTVPSNYHTTFPTSTRMDNGYGSTVDEIFDRYYIKDKQGIKHTPLRDWVTAFQFFLATAPGVKVEVTSVQLVACLVSVRFYQIKNRFKSRNYRKPKNKVSTNSDKITK